MRPDAFARGRFTVPAPLAHGEDAALSERSFSDYFPAPPTRRTKASTGGATVPEPITAMSERQVHEALSGVKRALYWLALSVLLLACVVAASNCP